MKHYMMLSWEIYNDIIGHTVYDQKIQEDHCMFTFITNKKKSA